MLEQLDAEGIFIKTIFDGFDFIQSEVGQQIIPNRMFLNIIRTTYISKLYDNASDFLNYCSYQEDGYLPKELMKKYKVGKYSLKNCFDENNPWKEKPYILFNSKEVTSLYKAIPSLGDIEFWVCPAFNEEGNCDAIGFRVTYKQDVRDAFKWIFTCGNNIIYGRDTVNKEEDCYVVEGFRDYVALRESGYNVIGLGSVVISNKQAEYLKQLKPILLFDNDSFGLKKLMQYKDKYRIATLIGTKEKDAWDSYSKGEKIKICEIE